MPSAVWAQDKTLVWNRFDVNIAVQEDGTFTVAEEQTIDFTSGSFSFGYREIPIQNFDYIDGWQIRDAAGNQYRLAQTSGTPYTFTVDEQSARYVIYWYFPSVGNAVGTYTLQYTVHGGLRYYAGGDQVWWKAIYGERDFPVLAGAVTVSLPTPAEVMEWAAYVNEVNAPDRATAAVSDSQNTIQFELDGRLRAGEEFEVRVQFTPGVVAGTAPAWQSRADAEAAAREAELARQAALRPWATLGFGSLGLLLLLGGPTGLYLLWYRRGRDNPVALVADYLPEPPSDLAPGIAGTLLDEKVDMPDVIATLIDLAQRKEISITEEKQEGFFHTGTDFIYRREGDAANLLPHEQQLLRSLFGKHDEVRLSDLKNKFYEKLPAIRDTMYHAVTEAGFFSRNPNSTRQLYATLGVVGLVMAFVVGIALVAVFGDLTVAAILPGIGLGATALGLLLLSQVMPRKTEKGALAAAQWQAFKRYLQNIDKYADMEAQKAIWDRWLPFAIAFEIDKEYIRKFEAVEAPAPGWYIPNPTLYGPYRRRYYGQPWVGNGPGSGGSSGSGGNREGGMGGGLGDLSRGMGTSLTSMSAGLGALLSSAGTTMTSQPSGSSGGGWSGGGGGFSGGGSFGGGGGGGGGGGFG
jgi:hypothetical protein